MSESIVLSVASSCHVALILSAEYIKLVSQYRFVCIGELLTTAGWIRKFVTTHPDYKKDSVVSEKISYDLYKAMKRISDGTLTCPELMGSFAV